MRTFKNTQFEGKCMPRIAIVRKDRCNPQGCGGYLCARVCPVNMEGKECIKPGPPPDKKAWIDETLCTGCGICPKRCPYDAIDIINLPEELDKPIHRYGRNGFHLYKLPTPIFGKVIGIVGRNGVGKSTALKILAGQLKPNLGGEEEADFDRLVEYFKGAEAQKFFEMVRDGKVVVSYKPQHVELLARTVKGKVRELLRKVDERDAFDEVVEVLSLKEVLDRDIKQVSGGELQRIAIAAASLKRANLYIFDEPSSYLDVKQRIRVSKFLHGLADENTSVLIVEHDLVILDYMTDLLHIMYGRPGAYGIVSLPKPTRSGMNTYLSGFIREENMRFRNYEIKFHTRPPVKGEEKPVITSWHGLRKTLDSFKLDATEGKLRKGEIVGVLGQNGIGKTTFVKMLADVLKPEEGQVDVQVRVSYKPQYLEGDSDMLVSDLLGGAVHKHDVQLIRPLELKYVLLSPLKSLSGGELQRVAIAKCLSEEADLYLLDEPSAYLDIEQRLQFGKMVRDIADQRGCTILVVDHDLLFVDNVSDKLLVFEGTPARQGDVRGPFEMQDGMNEFLQTIDVTLRRDKESKRPRINKPGSQLDKEQKKSGKLYYA